MASSLSPPRTTRLGGPDVGHHYGRKIGHIELAMHIFKVDKADNVSPVKIIFKSFIIANTSIIFILSMSHSSADTITLLSLIPPPAKEGHQCGFDSPAIIGVFFVSKPGLIKLAMDSKSLLSDSS